MKLFPVLLLLLFCFVVGGAEVVKCKLSAEYCAGVNAAFGEADAIALSLGKKINKGEFHSVRPDKDGLVDFAVLGAAFKRGRERTPGLLAAELIAENDGLVAIGCGVDWWFSCFVNGKKAYSTMMFGNDVTPIGKLNHPFFIPVKKGINRVVLLVHSGSLGMKSALGLVSVEEVKKNQIRDYSERKPYITQASVGTVTLNFFTDKKVVAFVDYRPAGENKWARSYDYLGGQARNDRSKHTVKLTGLKKNTVYEYRTGFVQQDYSEKTDEIRTFRSFTDENVEFKLFYTSDTQFPLKRMSRIVQNFMVNCKGAEADIFFHGGDICNTYPGDTDNIFLNSFLNVLGAEMKHTPIVAVSRGNHEYRGHYSGDFFRYFGGRDNKSYGMFRQGNVCFIVLDAGEDKPRIPKTENYGRTFDRELMKEQRAWLEKTVKSPEFQTAKFRIVLLHSPMTERYMGASEKILTNGLFTGEKPQYKIHLWVTAHTHLYARTLAAGKNAVRCQDERAAQYRISPFAKNSLLIINDGPGGRDLNISGLLFHFKENEINIKAMTPAGGVFDHFSVFPDGSLKEHDTKLKLMKLQ